MTLYDKESTGFATSVWFTPYRLYNVFMLRNNVFMLRILFLLVLLWNYNELRRELDIFLYCLYQYTILYIDTPHLFLTNGDTLHSVRRLFN